MSYTLYVGDYAYSSWSLRGWLLLDGFGIPFTRQLVPMYSAEFTQMQRDHAPARTVPSLRMEADGRDWLVWETLAIAETLAERHPEAGLWPQDAAARGAMRALASEMHAGFRDLRAACPMNLRKRYKGFAGDDGVRGDVTRIEMLFAWALERFGGPFLGGADFGAVDAMYAPVATRLVTYGFALAPATSAYVAAIYAHPSFRRWHALADASPRILDRYDMWIAEAENAGPPRPAPLPAMCHEGTPTDAINTVCPYSGKPVRGDSLARIDGRIVGFCNPFCRDKSVADAEAWPGLMALLRG